jgi:hypothetical protein
MLDHSGELSKLPGKGAYPRARTPTIHHRAYLATVPCLVAPKRSEPPPRLSSPPYTRSGGLQEEARPGARLRLRLSQDRLHEECSATTLRRRRDEWIEAGAMEALEELALESYDRIVGLENLPM